MWNRVDDGFGIDLGTCNTLIYRTGHGIVLNEPSVVAIDQRSGDVLAYGNEAYAMIGRTPAHVEVVYPLQNGAVADFDITQNMLKYYIGKVLGSRRFWTKPKTVISVPCGITNVNQRAVEETIIHKRQNKAITIEEPIAAAIGGGLPFNEPVGSMMMDIGGGTLQVAVMSMGGIVVSQSLPHGSTILDLEITEYIKKTYSLSIGARTAETIKQKLGSALVPASEQWLDVRGIDLVDGLPHTISICSSEIYHLVNPYLETLIHTLRTTLENCPPELAGDIMEHGVVLCGGGSLLHGLNHRLQDETGIPYHLAEQPQHCVVLGAGQVAAQLFKGLLSPRNTPDGTSSEVQLKDNNPAAGESLATGSPYPTN